MSTVRVPIRMVLATVHKVMGNMVMSLAVPGVVLVTTANSVSVLTSSSRHGYCPEKIYDGEVMRPSNFEWRRTG